MDNLLYGTHLVVAAFAGAIVALVALGISSLRGGRRSIWRREHERARQLAQFRRMSRLGAQYAKTAIPLGHYLVVEWQETIVPDFYSAIRLLLSFPADEITPAIFDSRRQLICYKSNGIWTAPDVLATVWSESA